MQKTAQAWFSGGPSGAEKPPSSLLADWNSYAAARSAKEADPSSLDFDLEAAVRTANDKVAGTFNQVSKGVRGLPGSFSTATSNVPSGKSLLYFGLFLASGVFFVFIAFTLFLPVMVLMPQKFAICFTLGCAFIVGSFFALKGPRNQLLHMSSKDYALLHGEYLPGKYGHMLCSRAENYTCILFRSMFLQAATRDYLSRWDLWAAWWVRFTCPWCFIVTSSLFYSLCSSLILSVCVSLTANTAKFLSLLDISHAGQRQMQEGSSVLKFLSSTHIFGPEMLWQMMQHGSVLTVSCMTLNLVVRCDQSCS